MSIIKLKLCCLSTLKKDLNEAKKLVLLLKSFFFIPENVRRR